MVISVFHMSVAFFHGKVRKVIRVVPPKGLRKKGRIWKLLLKSLFGTRDASPVFATYVHEGLSEHGFRRNAVVPCLYWCAVLEALGVHWVDIMFSLPGGRANDLEQLMREAFKVKICERVRPGFFFAVEFLHRKVACNTEGFSWTLDPKPHTGHWLNGKKQVEQAKWHVSVAPRSKTVGKGWRDGADTLDDQETQQWSEQYCTWDRTDQ